MVLGNRPIGILKAGLSQMEEARASLANLCSQIEAVRNDPARVATGVREYLAQYSERVRQQALAAAIVAQRATPSQRQLC